MQGRIRRRRGKQRGYKNIITQKRGRQKSTLLVQIEEKNNG